MKSKPTKQQKAAHKRRKRRQTVKKIKQRAVSALLVLFILIAVAITFDYVLYRLGRLPLCAVKVETEECIEHVGLLYVVSDYRAYDPARPYEWDWLWHRFRIERVG